MAKILWVPIEIQPHQTLSAQRIGSGFLWRPSPSITNQLQQDWEELIELITLGQFEKLSAHPGRYLQIRPKAANAKTFIRVINQQGQTISIIPKGFYLRTLLTQQILKENTVF